MKIVIRVALLLVLLSTNLVGQYVTDHISLEEGLSDIQCFDVFEDQEGYLWIGNRAGVNKYDGRDLVKYDRTNGLLADHIYFFYEDSKNRIWITNLNGEPMFIQNGEVHNRLTDPYLEGMKTKFYKDFMYEDSSGKIWFPNDNEWMSYLDGEDVVHLERPKGIMDGNEIIYLTEYKDSQVVVTFQWIYTIVDNKLIEATPYPKGSAVRCQRIGDIVYLTTVYNVLEYDLKSKKFEILGKVSDIGIINEISEIDGELVLSTFQGCYVLRDNKLEHMFGDLLHIPASAISKSKSNYWIATRLDGIYSIRENDSGINKFSSFPNVSYLGGKESKTYVGSEKSFITIDENQNIVNEIKTNGSFVGALEFEDEMFGFTKNSIFIDGMTRFNYYKRDAVYSEKHKQFYLTNRNGLNVVGKDYFFNLGFQNLVFQDHVVVHPIYQAYKVVLDDKNDVWVGGENGMYHLVKDSLHSMNVDALKGSIIDHEIDQDVIYGINYGKGVFRYSISDKKAILIDKQDGLPTLNCSHIAVNDDLVYVSHAYGISKVEFDQEEIVAIQNFGHGHGIPKGEITLLSIVDDQLYYTIDKATYYLNDMSNINDTLKIRLDESQVENYPDQNISIDFDCINYNFARDLKYKYRLLPNDEWQSTENEKVSFQYLPSGEYTFEVKAEHPLQLISPISSKSIVISDRWYKSSLFYALIGICLILFISFLNKIGVVSFSLVTFKVFLKKWLQSNLDTNIKIKDIKGAIQIIDLEDVNYIKASGNYILIHTVKGEIMMRYTMSKTSELIIKNPAIIRVHRSYFANLSRMSCMEEGLIMVDGHEVPYSKSFKKSIVEYLNENTQ